MTREKSLGIGDSVGKSESFARHLSGIVSLAIVVVVVVVVAPSLAPVAAAVHAGAVAVAAPGVADSSCLFYEVMLVFENGVSSEDDAL